MNTDPEKHSDPSEEKTESLAERSARLEAEAAALNEQAAQQQQEPEVDEPQSADEIADALYGETQDDPESLNSEQSELIIKSLQNEVDTLKDQAARALAEAENTRRRAQRDREDASKFAVTSFAKDMLDIADNLARALEAMPTDLAESEPRLKNLMDGIEGTQRVMLKTFEKHGIQKIEPLDEPFNPNFHEVMFEAPVPGKPAGLVMQVMEPGYILNERLLRAAKVGVTKDDGSGNQEPPAAGGTLDTEA